jgi:acetylornithine/succinyldiaminopimelate/putrescine aminotransferase
MAGVYWRTSTFFPNFWTESEAAAQKFARSATGRAEILYCDHAFHRAG